MTAKPLDARKLDIDPQQIMSWPRITISGMTFPFTNPAELIEQMRSIFQQIASQSDGIAAPWDFATLNYGKAPQMTRLDT